jgi:7-dehydrocholesterol reductase
MPAGVLNQLKKTVGPLALIVLFPISAWPLWYTATTLDGSVSALFRVMAAEGVFTTLKTIIGPHVLGSPTSLAMVLSFAAFQLLLMRLIPGRYFSGLYCFLLTMTVFLACTFVLGLFSPAIIFDHLADLIGTLNCLSLLLCVFLYFKGRFFPSTSEYGIL